MRYKYEEISGPNGVDAAGINLYCIRLATGSEILNRRKRIKRQPVFLQGHKLPKMLFDSIIDALDALVHIVYL